MFPIFFKTILSATVFACLSLYSSEITQEEYLAKKIYAHIEIHDPHSGSLEAEKALLKYPRSEILYEAYLHALSKEGNENKLLQAWKVYKEIFENPYKRDVLETMAWGTLRASSHSASPLIRVLAVLGAFYGQDADGIEILNKSMKDPNSLVRLTAVQMSSQLRDAKLGLSILELLKEEKNWNIRLEAIRAAGSMKLLPAKRILTALLSDDLATEEERAAAMKALVQMVEKASRTELERLAHSPRSGMRALACQIIEHLDLNDHDDILLPLLKDCHSGVRSSALHAIGILGCLEKQKEPIKQLCLECLQDSHPQVVVMAAWVLFPVYPVQASEVFKTLALHHDSEIALMASGALSATGQSGVDLMVDVSKRSNNAYVKLNLALGLIQQRQYVEEGCLLLYDSIMSHREKWMWDDTGSFKVIAPSSIGYDELMPNHSEVVNQMTRLEILNVLAMMKFPQAQTAIRHCLQQKTIGITAFASALLLTEGDESSIELVENLLGDQDQKISLQAALVLAIWGGGEKALNTLYHAYNTSDRSVKEQILEGLGKIAEPSSIPFLSEKLQEPYPSLRIIAAVALLVCLNH